MNLKEIVFIIGGCKSGKSSHALDLARQTPGERRIFIATCIPRDTEMKNRVKRHQEDRGDSWTTLEIPIRLSQTLIDTGPIADVIVVDCLTLWLSNLFGEYDASTIMNNHVKRLTEVLRVSHCPVILVSNEVGMGIVPENTLAREYRDVIGYINQAVAACADRVIFTMAGIPMTIKGNV